MEWAQDKFGGLQTCPSLVKFTSVRNVKARMK